MLDVVGIEHPENISERSEVATIKGRLDKEILEVLKHTVVTF